MATEGCGMRHGMFRNAWSREEAQRATRIRHELVHSLRGDESRASLASGVYTSSSVGSVGMVGVGHGCPRKKVVACGARSFDSRRLVL